MYRMNGWRTPPKPTAKENHMHCCYDTCTKHADFEIIEKRDDIPFADAYTTACEEHVGEMLSSSDLERGCSHWHVAALVKAVP